MVEVSQILTPLRSAKSILFKKYRLKEMAIFGSVSRGEAKEFSDIDILVDYEGQMGLEFVDLADELEMLLKAKVDLVSKQALKPKFLSRIESELVYV